MNPLHRILSKALLLSLLLLATACAHTGAKDSPIDTSTWPPHCFGRFQIDLPPSAIIRATYTVWGDQIIRTFKHPIELKTQFDQREQQLKSEKHKTKGNMFVDRVAYGHDSEGIYAWNTPSSSIVIVSESYLASSDKNAIYLYNGDIAPHKLSSANAFMKDLASHIRSLRPNTLPTEPGFCIDGGYIAGRDFQSEGFRVGISLPNHPGAHIALWSSTGAGPDTLLERTRGFFRNHVLGPVVGLHTLRKGKHNLGAIPGEEYLVASSHQGQRLYAFKWESQGKDDSLTEPNLSLELNVIGKDLDEDDPPPPKAFKSDKEALQLWDALLSTLRLRPGAA